MKKHPLCFTGKENITLEDYEKIYKIYSLFGMVIKAKLYIDISGGNPVIGITITNAKNMQITIYTYIKYMFEYRTKAYCSEALNDKKFVEYNVSTRYYSSATLEFPYSMLISEISEEPPFLYKITFGSKTINVFTSHKGVKVV